MSRVIFRVVVTLALLLASSVAFAHPGHGESSLLAGFIHPFGGIDHLLAMTAVGLFASHLGGRALLAVPATFAAVMAVGGIFGAAGMSLPAAETAIAVSFLVFGFVIYSGIAPPILAATALVGIFAIFHGYAHGREMPIGSFGVLYGVGFMAATVLLHGFGIMLGLAISRLDELTRRRAMQACGATIALVGTGLTVGLV